MYFINQLTSFIEKKSIRKIFLQIPMCFVLGFFVISLCILPWNVFYIPIFFMPAIWLGFKKRFNAIFFIFGYFSGALWEIIPGLYTYFYGSWSAVKIVLIFLFSTLLLCLPWWILWPTHCCKPITMLVLLFLIMLITLFPPLGIIYVAQPLMASGVFFPGLKLYGLLLGALVIFVSAYWVRYRSQKSFVILSCLLLFSVIVNALYKVPVIPSNWHHYNDYSLSFFGDHENYIISEVQKIKKQNQFFIFPENYLIKSERSQLKLAALQRIAEKYQSVIVVGVYIDGQKEQNQGVAIISKKGVNFLQTRQPVPVLSWRPGNAKSMSYDWRAPSVVLIDGRFIWIVVCFENFVSWQAILVSATHSNLNALISLGNLWWAPMSLHLKEKHAGETWARLLHVPFLQSVKK